MFGNAPRALWSRWLTPDERHRVPLACRTLLVREPHRNILLETGIGASFPPKLRDRYGVNESHHVLLDGLEAQGLTHEDIDIVILSHLHFDHAGGLLSAFDDANEPTLLFPNAQFVVSDLGWERAQQPHARDRASFLPNLNRQLAACGRLVLVDTTTPDRIGCDVLGDAWSFHVSNGHTPGLLLAERETSGGPIVFAGDLIPGTAWVHVPITMGYDRFPELLIDEKHALLEDLHARGGRLFYTHDPDVAMSGVGRDERGRFHAIDPQTDPMECTL